VEAEIELGRGRARIRCRTDSAHRESVVVRDRAGSNVAAGRYGRLHGIRDRLSGREHVLIRTLSAQLAAFGSALRGGDPGPLASAADGAAAMSASDAIRRSAALDGAEVLVEFSEEEPAATPVA
jgi:hypothetical protein